ncbi:MAG: alkaline phosphatase family protein [Bryobacterales bacterium]|nr:alkaline phosphatase family protein [Bryobacterales bacterium]
MQRRAFVFGWLGARVLEAADAGRRSLVILVDGLGPEYIEASEMPNLRRMGAGGFSFTGRSVIPSVTNVNNASLVTASFPEEHGITTNYYYDAAARSWHPMETSEFLLRPTLFEKIPAKTAMVTAKNKVLTLLARGATTAIAAERPPVDLPPAPGMYTAEVNHWCIRAAQKLLQDRAYRFVYLSTTDYMMHTYPPEDQRSRDHLRTFDAVLGEILDAHSDLDVFLTADHGMNAKTEGFDVKRWLHEKGFDAEAVPIIRDKHVVHHGNLGGACYVYLHNPSDLERAEELLRKERGVEEIYRRDEAARRFRLKAGRIGDLFLLGTREIAFGELGRVREPVKVRSHGSRHEATVPLYGSRKWTGAPPEFNVDLTRRNPLDS